MQKTIDDVIKTYESVYKLEVKDNKRVQYTAFIRRQLKKHNEYKLNEEFIRGDKKVTYPYINLLIDKLLVYSILVKDREVIKEQGGAPIILEKKEDLVALKYKGLDNMWDDLNLRSVSNRRIHAQDIFKHKSFLTYTEIVDELLQDKDIVKIWGKLTYEDIKRISLDEKRKPKPPKDGEKWVDRHSGVKRR